MTDSMRGKKEVDYAGCSVGCLGAVLDLTAFPVLYGWVITVLWRWFVVPTFGLKPLSLAVAIGLDLLVSLLTVKYWLRQHHDYTAWEYGTAILGKASYPLVALYVGWLALRVLA